jgi:hypothetical protein
MLPRHHQFQPQPALGSSVAAIAYDRKANRLYYAPMSIDQLYIDLTTMGSGCVFRSVL